MKVQISDDCQRVLWYMYTCLYNTRLEKKSAAAIRPPSSLNHLTDHRSGTQAEFVEATDHWIP